MGRGKRVSRENAVSEILTTIEEDEAHTRELLMNSWKAHQGGAPSLGTFRLPEGSFRELTLELDEKEFRGGYILAILVAHTAYDVTDILWFPSMIELRRWRSS